MTGPPAPAEERGGLQAGWLSVYRRFGPMAAVGTGLTLLAASIGLRAHSPAPWPLLLVGLVLVGTVVVVSYGAESTRWLVPALAVFAAIVFGGLTGGPPIHLIPVLTMLGAGFVLAGDRSRPDRRLIVSAAAGTGLLSVLLAGVIIRPRSSGSSGFDGFSRPNADEPVDGEPTSAAPEWLSEAFGRLQDLLGLQPGSVIGDGEGRGGRSGGELVGDLVDRSDPSIDWWLLLGLLVALLVLLVLAWLLHRRWANRGQASSGSRPGSLVARFETVGEAAGTIRPSNQGLVEYGRRFSTTADDRPGRAGAWLSSLLFDPSAGGAGSAERAVEDLERRPPESAAEDAHRTGRVLGTMKRRRFGRHE